MSCCCWSNKVKDNDTQSKSPIIKLFNNIKKSIYSPKIERNPIPINYPKNCINCNSVYYHSRLVDYCSGECKLSYKYYGSCSSSDFNKSSRYYHSPDNYICYNSD